MEKDAQGMIPKSSVQDCCRAAPQQPRMSHISPRAQQCFAGISHSSRLGLQSLPNSDSFLDSVGTHWIVIDSKHAEGTHMH